MASKETTVVRWGAMNDDNQPGGLLRDAEREEKFEKLYFKEKYRYTFFWWGEKQKVPATFPPCTSVPLKQVVCGGKHFIALSGTFHMCMSPAYPHFSRLSLSILAAHPPMYLLALRSVESEETFSWQR